MIRRVSQSIDDLPIAIFLLLYSSKLILSLLLKLSVFLHIYISYDSQYVTGDLQWNSAVVLEKKMRGFGDS